MNNKQLTQIKTQSVNNILSGAFSFVLLVGIAVCIICDMAISQALTWSLYPVSSIVFAWLVFIPVMRFGNKGICGTLISCSIFIFPYLFILNRLLKTSRLFLPVSLCMSVVGLAYFWIVFILFTKMKTRKLLAAALTVLLLIPANLFISLILSKMIKETFMDVWDIAGCFIVIITAIALFITDLSVHKKAASH